MAGNEVFRTEDITLQDGREVTLKPLPILRLREFMKAWQKISEVPEGDDGFDVFVNCSGIALKTNFEGDEELDPEGGSKGLVPTAQEKTKGEFLSKKYKTYLTEVLDLDTIYKILEVCGGIKLNDPKLMEEALRAAE